MTKLKILTLNHEFPPVGGGAAPVTLELCKYLVKAGHQVDVVTMHYKKLPRFEVKDGINIYRTPAIRKRANICHTHELATYLPGALAKTLKLCKQKKYDIIHCHFLVPGGVLALIVSNLTGIPFIVTSHGSDVPGYNPDRFQLQHNLTKPILKSVCKSAEKIVCPSIYLKNLISKNIGRFDLEHIPNGIDLRNSPMDLSKPKQNIILSTGRLLKRKGFHTLIKAVHDISIPFDVHIAGDGPYREHLEKMAADSITKIVFHGWLQRGSQELLELYERASIYVLASARENASISLLEAMAAKCAVITTNVTGCPETIGDAGFLIDFDDADRMKQILTNISSNKKLIEEYSEKAYNRVKSEFDWQQITQQYIRTYQTGIQAKLL